MRHLIEKLDRCLSESKLEVVGFVINFGASGEWR